MSNSGGIVNINGIQIGNEGIQSNTSTKVTSSYTTVGSGLYTFYPVAVQPENASYRRLHMDTTGSYQTQSIFWVNAGGGDNRMHLSNILDIGYIYLSSSTIQYYDIIPLSESVATNNSATGDAVIWNISQSILTGSRYYQYQKIDWHSGSTMTMTIPSVITGSVTGSGIIIWTIPPTGSHTGGTYLHYWDTVQTAGGKTTMTVRTPISVAGVTDYNTGNLSEGKSYTNGYALFISSSETASFAPYAVMKSTPPSSSIYFAYGTDGDGSYGSFVLSGSLGTILKAGTVIQVNGQSLLINQCFEDTQSVSGPLLDRGHTYLVYSSSYTKIYTTTNPFGSDLYYPITITAGNSANSMGYGGITNTNNQVVIGTYNVTSSYSDLFIIGNGASTSRRSNILTVSRNSASIYGSLTVTAGITGTLFGTSSQAISSSLAISSSVVAVSSTDANGTYYLHFGNQTSGHDNIEVDTNLTYNPSTNQLTATGFTGSLFGTSSWARSSSQALTASYVNPLNQIVTITGSIILSSSAPTAVPGGIYYNGTDFYLGF